MGSSAMDFRALQHLTRIAARCPHRVRARPWSLQQRPRIHHRHMRASTTASSQDAVVEPDVTPALENVFKDQVGVWFNLPNEPRFLEHIALRHMCQCPQCVDLSTRQRHFAFASIPATIQAIPRLIGSTKVEIRWENDVPGFGSEHVSQFSLDQILRRTHFYHRAEVRHLHRQYEKWDREHLSGSRPHLEFDFSPYLKKDSVRNVAVIGLVKFGIIFIRRVPRKVNSVQRILERIGPLRNTFYGETWDVRSVPDAANVAYTAQDLGFHQDLLYMANPPGLQALHVMQASESGGESLFTDGAHSVDRVLREHPDLAPSLFYFPVTYRYKNAGEWYEYSRPTLEGSQGMGYEDRTQGEAAGYGQQYTAINWSPPFQGPFEMDNGLMVGRNRHPSRPFPPETQSHLHKYHEAAAILQAQFEHPDSVYETRMEGGTCVIFNNRRILHARKAFPAGGSTPGGKHRHQRWLRGAYGDLDALMSRYRKARQTASPFQIKLKRVLPWNQALKSVEESEEDHWITRAELEL